MRLNPFIRKESVTPRGYTAPPDAYVHLANGNIDPTRTICFTSATQTGSCETNRHVSALLRHTGFEMSWVFDDKFRTRSAIYAQFPDEALVRQAYDALDGSVVPWDSTGDRFEVRRVTDAHELQRMINSTTRIFINLGPAIYRGRPLAPNTFTRLDQADADDASEYFLELWCAGPPRCDEDLLAYVSRSTGMNKTHVWRIVRPTWYAKADVLHTYDLADFMTIMMRLIS
jgi:hypothetical protein